MLPLNWLFPFSGLHLLCSMWVRKGGVRASAFQLLKQRHQPIHIESNAPMQPSANEIGLPKPRERAGSVTRSLARLACLVVISYWHCDHEGSRDTPTNMKNTNIKHWSAHMRAGKRQAWPSSPRPPNNHRSLGKRAGCHCVRSVAKDGAPKTSVRLLWSPAGCQSCT